MIKYQILCVDDEEGFLPIYHKLLENLPYEVLSFSSCIKALEHIKQNKKKIIYIFSDYRMEEMSGVEFRKQVNEVEDNIPFSLVTGFYNLELAKTAMEFQINSFLNKPVNGNELKNLINTLGEKRKNALKEDNDMVLSFIEESFPMLEEIEELIISLEANPESESILNTYFRLLHTIKGTASCVGLINIPKFTHKYEDLVVKLKNKELTLNSIIAETLLKGLDQLKYMYAEAKKGLFEVNIENALLIFDMSTIAKESPLINNVEPTTPKGQSTPIENKNSEDKIGVTQTMLDDFMELSGQLTVIRNTLIKNALLLEQRYFGDNEIEVLQDSLSDMHKVSSILQKNISEMRKVSLETIYKPLKRVVRDSSKLLNKNIDFQIEGESLRVDTAIGKALSNSLVHLIRNSIDHGIEIPSKRTELGKKSSGTISLKSFQDGDIITIMLADDGNGLNINKIKQKAIEKKLFTEDELSKMTEQKLFSIIFNSGFSTAQQVTDISGRGVGMDMVKNSIEAINGKIIIDSKLGQGSKFILSFPVPKSVLIIKSLMVKLQNESFSVPLENVSEVVRIENYKTSNLCYKIEGSLILKHQEELISLLDLNKILYKRSYHDQCDTLDIVIVKGDDFKYGIIVDEILDIEEIVVKKFSKHFRSTKYFMGITNVGTNGLALILDLSLIAKVSQLKQLEEENIVSIQSKSTSSEQKDFMQFNLKESKNYAILLDTVSRLEEIMSSELETSGDVYLVRYRGEIMPILFIEQQLNLIKTDKNLTEHYPDKLKIIVVNQNNKKFGIVVDEILDIGSSLSTINTQNIDRDGIVGTVFIESKTITILDINFLIKTYIPFKPEKIELAA